VDRRVEIAPEVLAQLVAVLLAGRSVAPAEERAEVTFDDVAFREAVARSL
jgi:hypothetical protein